MEYQNFIFLLVCSIVSLANFSEGQTTLSTTLLKPNHLFDWDFPFRLFQYLPNPDYHGLEKQSPTEPVFESQKDCFYKQENLTVGSSGVITSPNYPANYAPGLRCQWALESEPGTVIRATFFDVVTQPWFLFFYDYLAVSLDGNWDKFYRLTGDMNRIAPISLESVNNKFGLRFASGFDVFNYRGFKMAYVVQQKAVADDSGATDGNSTAPAPSVDYGNGTDVSALCDYTPIALPPESSGEIPQRIVGGSEVFPHEYPFIVALVTDDVNFCSGSLIDEFHVLTAAHCTNGSKKIELFFGVHDMTKEEEDSRQYQRVGSERVVQHPNYNPTTSANDIAIIKLNRRIKTTVFVQPVYLPTIYSMGNNFIGWKLTTMGWGDTNKTSAENGESTLTPLLQKVTSPVISNEDCRKVYRTLITGNSLCTEGSTIASPCFGDSGSPLVAKFSRTQNTAEETTPIVNDDNQANQCYFTKSHRDRFHQEKVKPGHRMVTDWFVQVGILSFGSQTCGNGNPVAYTRVTAYLDFISGVVSSENYQLIN